MLYCANSVVHAVQELLLETNIPMSILQILSLPWKVSFREGKTLADRGLFPSLSTFCKSWVLGPYSYLVGCPSLLKDLFYHDCFLNSLLHYTDLHERISLYLPMYNHILVFSVIGFNSEPSDLLSFLCWLVQSLLLQAPWKKKSWICYEFTS